MKMKNKMQKSADNLTRLGILEIGIALIQLFDILIHAATDQLEVLRVSSNIIILLWLALVVLGRFKPKFLLTAFGSTGLYLILNVVFLAREGLTNPEQGGELRVLLFGLVFLTTTLSAFVAYSSRGTADR